MATIEDLLKLVHFGTPLPTGADILWLLKHVQLARAGSMHPTGMLSCKTDIFPIFVDFFESQYAIYVSETTGIHYDLFPSRIHM